MTCTVLPSRTPQHFNSSPLRITLPSHDTYTSRLLQHTLLGMRFTMSPTLSLSDTSSGSVLDPFTLTKIWTVGQLFLSSSSAPLHHHSSFGPSLGLYPLRHVLSNLFFFLLSSFLIHLWTFPSWAPLFLSPLLSSSLPLSLSCTSCLVNCRCWLQHCCGATACGCLRILLTTHCSSCLAANSSFSDERFLSNQPEASCTNSFSSPASNTFSSFSSPRVLRTATQ